MKVPALIVSVVGIAVVLVMVSAVAAGTVATGPVVTASGVTSCLLAVIPAVGLTLALNAVLGTLFFYAPLPFRISFLAVGIWTVLVIVGAMLATDAAATRASRLTVREALAYL